MRRDLPTMTTPAQTSTEPETRFFNRDISWLEFNRRVLHQSIDDRNPLLERVKFLAIFSSNLDEFVMKRVGQLKRQIAAGVTRRTPDGRTPEQVFAETRTLITELQDEQARCWEQDIVPELGGHGIEILRYHDLDEEERASLDRWYHTHVFPVLTPLAVDPGHRFPFLSNLSENLGILLSTPGGAERHFARVKIPDVLPRLVSLPDPAKPAAGTYRFVALDEIIIENLDELFPGMEIVDVTAFRVTRSVGADQEDEDEVEDLLEHVEAQIHMRRFAEAVRIETGLDPSQPIVELVINELGLSEPDVYQRRGPLEYEDLFTIANIPIKELHEKPWAGVTPPALADQTTDIFSTIRARDILVHHPYESFKVSVERFIDQASRDPDVLAIKQTLYRTTRDSPIIASLSRAAESGKSVACLVELRARFDEHKNVRFARQLEKHGVHVAYGVLGYKTHCKCSLVVRREGDTIRSYAHIGTGNYHPGTAQLYTDLGLLTADPEITGDVVNLFNHLTGRTGDTEYKRLIVAPDDMRNNFNELIDAEITNAKAGKPARIIGKINSMEDRKTADRLYEASGAGVKIDLIVRGFCCVRPGVPGLSENIRVISHVGRFLEHSRLFYFANAKSDPAEGIWLIGSADWMYRNLSARVEAAVPIDDPDHKKRLWRLIETLLCDRKNAWDLDSTGLYTLRTPDPNSDPDSDASIGAFEAIMRDTQTSS